jgi:hypothetical protein
MSQAADFFVSYTSADRAWAEWDRLAVGGRGLPGGGPGLGLHPRPWVEERSSGRESD